MSDLVKKAELPPTELGDDRCFEVAHSHQGDVVASTWRGALDRPYSFADEGVTSFGFYHGSEVTLFASMAGYLRRAGVDSDEVVQVMNDAGQEILSEGRELSFGRDAYLASMLGRIAQGGNFGRHDEASLGLECLVPPTPAQPGLIEKTGGTAIYTRQDHDLQKTLLVYGQRLSLSIDRGWTTKLGQTAEFCEQDIPTMARLVCELSLGEYRQNVYDFLSTYPAEYDQ